MTTRREREREDAHFRILRLLHENPEMSQRDLARKVGVSTGGIHYVLAALVEKGLIKLGNFTAAEDKRRYAYVLTPKGVARKTVLTRRFLARKMAEYEALKAEIEKVGAELPEDERAAIRTDPYSDEAARMEPEGPRAQQGSCRQAKSHEYRIERGAR